MLQHLRDAELAVFGVSNFVPQRTASWSEPRIEFGERAEASLAGLDPDASAAVLHVLDHALLPARGDVAEVGIEQECAQ